MGTQALLAPLCTGTCRGWWDVWLELPLSFATLQLWVLRTRRTDAVSALPASVAPSNEASAVMYALPQGQLGNEHVHGRSSGGRRAGPECTNIQLWIGVVSGKETSAFKMVLKFSCLCWTQPSLDKLHFFFKGEDFIPEWNSIASLGFSLFTRKKKQNSLKKAELELHSATTKMEISSVKKKKTQHTHTFFAYGLHWAPNSFVFLATLLD